LLRLALTGLTWTELDDQEIKRGGVSYTIDTVRDYAGRFPGATLHYLIGADHVEQLPKWREARELAHLLTFVVIPRPGQKPAAFPSSLRGHVRDGFAGGISSSLIRARIKAGLPVENLVPGPVAEAIRNNRLYL